MSHRFLSSALAELSEAAAFYDERVPGLGADFLDEVDAAVANEVPWIKPHRTTSSR